LVRGVILSIVYRNERLYSFLRVEYIIRNIANGNLIRLIHLNIASMFFLFIYLHLFRGIYYSSFKYKNTWNSGVTILFLLILTAFLGYVLPWGQISFWAATVITKFLRAIPVFGGIILIWVWRRFRVGNSTLKFFFSLHFLLPMILFLLILFHFIALHFKGSRSKLRFSNHHIKLKFFPFFLFKDFLNFAVIIFVFLIFSLWITSEGENFIIANPSVTPAHIKPEWYFLFAYAILRSIPHKLSGVILIALSILIFYTLTFFYIKYNVKSIIFLMFFGLCFCILSWVGYNEAVDLFVYLGLVFTFFYFFRFFIFNLKLRIFLNMIF
jgi:ubiquinol-cytochrome c reductase cytochrome b subunit